VSTLVKWVMAVCVTICVAVIFMPPAYLILTLTWERVKAERFYRERPLLNAMRQAYGGDSSKADRARDILLARFPIGSEITPASTALSREGFHCRELASRRNVQPQPGSLAEYAEQIRERYHLQKDPEPEREIRHFKCELLAAVQTDWTVHFEVGKDDRPETISVGIFHISL